MEKQGTYKVKGAMSQNANILVPLTFDKGLELLLHDIWAWVS